MADVLNRLIVNGAGDAAEVKADLDGKTATTPEALIQTLIETGHTVSVADARYFGPRGNPSTLSPIMLRWISAVPPAIVSENVSR